MSCGNGNNAPGNVNWNIAGRLSEFDFLHYTAAAENSGRRQTAAAPSRQGKLNGHAAGQVGETVKPPYSFRKKD